jgi:transposase
VHLIEELKKIPGIDMTLAVGIIAEATNDVSNFADERKFAAWAGVAAGNNESAGKKKEQNVEKARHTLGNSLSKLLMAPN